MTDPTPEVLVTAQGIVERFAHGKPESVVLSLHDWYVQEIVKALTEQAQAHPDCHPAALCDGSWPECERQTWEAAARLVDDLMEPSMGVNTGTLWRNTQTRVIAEKLRARGAARRTP